MSNETITPERIALPKQVVEALAQASSNDDVCDARERKILELGARIALAALANNTRIDHANGNTYFVHPETFLAPPPKLPKEWQDVVDNMISGPAPQFETAQLPVKEVQELAEKLFALTGGSQ